jgi:preprotein translocase YajC subunit
MFRRQKKEAAARQGLKKGDTIVTNAGIVGELVEVGEKFAKVKVAQGVTITVLTNVIAPLQEDPVAATKAVTATAGDKK